ncbi:MAG: choice-of-anchor Q domain-containing protein [Anaerolineae bacterium]
MSRKLLYLVLAWLAPLLLGIILFAGLYGQAQVHAQGIIYVDDDACPAVGTGTQVDPFCRIQDGVDTAVANDEIHVASGTYTGVQEIVGGYGYTYTQVVFVGKNLTLYGGYDANNWDASPDPATNVTTIDAQRQGRPLSIVGTSSNILAVTVEGFTLTGGDYTGLGNPPGTSAHGCAGTGIDCGGGMLAHYATLTLRHMIIFDNVASRSDSGRLSQGGGMYLWELRGDSLVEYTTVLSNSVGRDGGSYGGGILIQYGVGLTLRHSVIEDNAAFDSGSAGGGLYIFQPRGPVIIEDCDILGNKAYEAGGLDVNLTYVGEGLQMNRVTLIGNETTSRGAAIRVDKQGGGDTSARLTNLLLAENKTLSVADYLGIIDVGGGSSGRMDVMLAHVTAVNNQAATFLHVESYDEPATAVLTNTLVTSFTNAFVGSELNGVGIVAITHTNTLTENVALLHTIRNGMPKFTAVNPLTGDPKLDGDYRLQAGSAAIDAGVDAGVTTDIDGEKRPDGAGFDIGADEFAIYEVYLPSIFTR